MTPNFCRCITWGYIATIIVAMQLAVHQPRLRQLLSTFNPKSSTQRRTSQHYLCYGHYRLIIIKMRLLKFDDSGGFSLVGPFNKDIPEYAILSHTWEADGEEVTYEDLTNGTGNDKPGYSKIKFCVEQAYRDGFRHSWVDTCCINRADFYRAFKIHQLHV